MDSTSKRLSTSGSRHSGYRDALSNSSKTSSPASTNRSSDLDGQLRSSIGYRVKVTTSAQKTFEGTVFTFCPVSNILAINTGSSGSGSTYHFIPSSQIVSISTLSTEKDAEAMAPLPQLDVQALKAREHAAIEKMLAADQKRGKGVAKEAQELFNYFDRIIPSFWDNKSIIVNNNVRIDPPYGVEDCRAPKDSKQAEAQIRKMLEGYYAKKRDGGRLTPSGGVRPVVPAVPRKGG